MASRASSLSASPNVVCWPSSIRRAERDAGLFQRESRIDEREGYMRKKPQVVVERPRTDWARIDALTDEEIAAAVRDDPDAAPIADEEWFAGATIVMPKAKEQISIRLDTDVLEHFRKYPRYQTRINAILRAAMEHEKKAS
jgi:uncharacterized protein (DUF4415 family)